VPGGRHPGEVRYSGDGIGRAAFSQASGKIYILDSTLDEEVKDKSSIQMSDVKARHPSQIKDDLGVSGREKCEEIRGDELLEVDYDEKRWMVVCEERVLPPSPCER
jgi:hypothetical protein